MLLLLPVSAAGSLHAATATTTIGEKHGALSEVGRAIVDGGLSGATGYRAGLLGTATISPNGATGPNPSAPSSSGLTAAVLHPTSPQLLGSFAGVNKSTAGGYYPPDTSVAQSGVYVFELVNEYGKITSTSGATVYSTFTTQSFFGTTSTDNVGDIQVMYDQMSHRWVATADDFTTNTEYFDISKSTSPVGSWWAYYVVVSFSNGAAQFMDQPVWGASNTMFGMGTNQFNTTTSAFYGSILTVFNKVKAENGHLASQALGYGSYGSVHPARSVTNNGTGTDVLYAASTDFGGTTTLEVFEITGTVGTLSATAVAYTIANTGVVPGAVQGGTSTLLNSGDGRVESASWSSIGVLWVASTSACTPAGDATTRSCIRVDGVYTTTNLLLQDTNIAVAGLYLYYGALVALKSVGAGYLLVLGYSGALTYPSIAVTGQNSSDSYGSYRGPVSVFSGSSYDTSGRFGDYSGICLSNTGTKVTAWAASESEDTSGWTTEVVHFAFY